MSEQSKQVLYTTFTVGMVSIVCTVEALSSKGAPERSDEALFSCIGVVLRGRGERVTVPKMLAYKYLAYPHLEHSTGGG